MILPEAKKAPPNAYAIKATSYYSTLPEPIPGTKYSENIQNEA